MIAVSLLIPASLLGLVLALGRYEERMLGPADAGKPPAASDTRRLRVLPDPPPGAAPPAAAEAPTRPETSPRTHGGRSRAPSHAA
ncbi:hypothetical protein ACIHAA_18230 [Streptomyces sp. NPDC052040]|uniref:hypothetical protein n=1 Tax=unclassified Streptomyces TaxID=2593676 RepID=UPI0037D1BD7A